MKITPLHPWNMSPSDAIKLQGELHNKIILKNGFSKIECVAACDMALDPASNTGYAVVLVYKWPELRLIERQWAILPLTMPYIPGLLSYREAPVLTAALEKLEHVPDLYFFDGQGIAHPRGMGIAAHMGLLLDKPSIGCGKSKLYGRFKDPGPAKGDTAELYATSGEQIGHVLRTKPGCLPLFISPGHKVDLATSLELVLKTLDGYRIPKPTREADAAAALLKRGPLPPLPKTTSSLFD